jgi:hypothetical protein
LDVVVARWLRDEEHGMGIADVDRVPLHGPVVELRRARCARDVRHAHVDADRADVVALAEELDRAGAGVGLDHEGVAADMTALAGELRQTAQPVAAHGSAGAIGVPHRHPAGRSGGS